MEYCLRHWYRIESYLGMSEVIDAVRVRVLPDGRMDRANAAAYLGYAPKTLAIWLGQGKGPRYVKASGRVFYFKDDLDAFLRGESSASAA
jgi:hypothetical protein